ncbi:Transport permease protein [Vibrio chagasii]|nr:Transport permease protein [Vibrio chagasii]
MLFEAKFAKRSPAREFREITFSLFLRDIAQKFGEFKGGFFLALLEPVIHILTFCFILGRGVTDPEALRVIPVFVLSGLIPFLLLRNTVKGVMTSCKVNKAAFFYPRVMPYHAVASKALYESFVYVLSFCVIYALLFYFSYLPTNEFNAVLVLGMYLITLSIGLGVGLILMVCREFVPSIEKWINLIFRPMYFLSAIFYSVAIVPHKYLFIFEYNPCVHIIEFVRLGVMGSQPVIASISYALSFGLFSLFFGALLYKGYQDRLRSK